MPDQENKFTYDKSRALRCGNQRTVELDVALDEFGNFVAAPNRGAETVQCLGCTGGHLTAFGQ